MPIKNKNAQIEDCSHVFTRFYETDDGAVVNACTDCEWKYILNSEQEASWRKAMEEA